MHERGDVETDPDVAQSPVRGLLPGGGYRGLSKQEEMLQSAKNTLDNGQSSSLSHKQAKRVQRHDQGIYLVKGILISHF